MISIVAKARDLMKFRVMFFLILIALDVYASNFSTIQSLPAYSFVLPQQVVDQLEWNELHTSPEPYELNLHGIVLTSKDRFDSHFAEMAKKNKGEVYGYLIILGLPSGDKKQLIEYSLELSFVAPINLL